MDDCEHFVFPIEAPRRRVFDEKVETVAYDPTGRILEIHFKSGQAWQLSDVPPGIYAGLQSATISTFLKSIAHQYRASPVKTGMRAIRVPDVEKCGQCGEPMVQKHRAGSDFEKFVRVLWACSTCATTAWKKYGEGLERERRSRWH